CERPKSCLSALLLALVLSGGCSDRTQPLKRQDKDSKKAKPRATGPGRALGSEASQSNAERSIRQAMQIKRGEEALARGRHSEALTHLRQALATLPGSPRSAHIHFLMGRAHEQAGQPQQAIVAFEKGVAIEPSNPTGHYLLALAYKATKRLERALQAIRRAVSLAPRVLVYHFDQVTIELDLGRKLQGERSYQDYEKLRNDLVAQLKATQERKRIAAARALGTVPVDMMNLRALRDALGDKSASVRAEVAQALADSGTPDPSVRKALSVQLAQEKNSDVIKAIRGALGRLPLPQKGATSSPKPPTKK
ncbi:MAG: tetratricopeptide repeat protein, partial [bacterium]